MKLIKWIPNLVSFLRGIASAPLILLPVLGKWEWAFLIFILGLASDALDGWLAVHLDARTALGKWMDDICDIFFSVGALAGLVLGGIIPSGATVPLALMLAIFYPSQFWPEQSKWRIFGNGVIVLLYLIVIFTLCITYAHLVFGARAWWLIMPVVLIGWAIIYAKRQRAIEFLCGQN